MELLYSRVFVAPPMFVPPLEERSGVVAHSLLARSLLVLQME